MIGAQAVKGPLAGMLETLGHEVGAVGVAAVLAPLAGGSCSTRRSKPRARRATLGLSVACVPTLMHDTEARGGGARRARPGMSDLAVFGLRGLPELQRGRRPGRPLLAACDALRAACATATWCAWRRRRSRRSRGGPSCSPPWCRPSARGRSPATRPIRAWSSCPARERPCRAPSRSLPDLRDASRLRLRRGWSGSLQCRRRRRRRAAPVDPDASAERLRDALAATADVAVIISDSFGRPFRLGTTGVAVGCAGLAPVQVHTGERDDAGRVLQGTEVHVADQIAAAAELVVGPYGGVPAAVVRGLAYESSDVGARSGSLPADRDLFRG